MKKKLSTKILILAKDEVQRTSLCNIIEEYGFHTLKITDISALHRVTLENKPNLIIISLKSLNVSALSVIKKVKTIDIANLIPLILIMDKNTSNLQYKKLDRELLEVIYKSFIPACEIISTIKSLLTRSHSILRSDIIKYKNLSMDLNTFKVTIDMKQVHLRMTEFKILKMFVESPKTVFSKQKIIDLIWEKDRRISSETVDVYINRLRKSIKLNKYESESLIKTIRMSGYCLSLPGEAE